MRYLWQQKKVGKLIFLTPLFVAVFGSGIRDRQKSGSGFRDKHPGSATLFLCQEKLEQDDVIFLAFL